LILSFDLAAALRRIKAGRMSGVRARRHDDDVAFVPDQIEAGPELMLDTCVYIDIVQGRVPPRVEDLLVVRIANHSAICLAELTHLFGRLDPHHPQTAAPLRELRGIIDEDIPHHRLTAPSTRALGEAGMLAGLTMRLTGRSKDQALLNDAILYLHALERGCIVLTRNLADFDVFQQLVPTGRVLLYRQA
jgi:predicted nucleic acid-binding protein